MSPSKIMLIRHAERPSSDKTVRGVSLEGAKDKEELTVRGWQRAGALVRFFAPLEDRFSNPALARPDILFACRAGPEAPSLRPQHTLMPLAGLLKVEFNCAYWEGEEAELVRAVLAAKARTALISWKHRNMHVIANEILGNTTNAPQFWPIDRVDLVWIFDRSSSGWAFTQIPQLLLAGDRPGAAA
ncbi:MAG: histidine phosphatase family protein [Methylocapsa sp.]|nr:histidine phosphatase family protein [Methylocapsa sp.]